MGNAPEEKKATTAEIGGRLRQARENKGLTIVEAQKQTRIHSNVLAALEKGRCDDILTPNYVKSFLREYSNFLGFDSQAVVNEYLAAHPELKSRNVNAGLNKSDMKASADLAKTIRMTRAVALALVLIFLAVFISSKTIAFFKNMKSSRKTAYSKAASRPAAASSKKAAVRNNTSAKNAPFTLVLKVKNPVMVGLKKDGVLIFKRVLPKGIEEAFKVNNSVNISVGRAESIEIIVNGKSFGAPGRGVIRDIEVTSNGVRVR